MKKAEEYRTHAAQCIQLARKTPNEQHKAQLLTMADTWAQLAAYREKKQSEANQ